MEVSRGLPQGGGAAVPREGRYGDGEMGTREGFSSVICIHCPVSSVHNAEGGARFAPEDHMQQRCPSHAILDGPNRPCGNVSRMQHCGRDDCVPLRAHTADVRTGVTGLEASAAMLAPVDDGRRQARPYIVRHREARCHTRKYANTEQQLPVELSRRETSSSMTRALLASGC